MNSKILIDSATDEKSSTVIYQLSTELMWGYSSVGRAPALQAGGQEFESLYLHQVDNYDKRVLINANSLI